MTSVMAVDDRQMPRAAVRPSVGYMTTTTIFSIIVGVAIAALLVVRQMRSEPVNGNMRLPLIIGIIGLIEVTSYLQTSTAGSAAPPSSR